LRRVFFVGAFLLEKSKSEGVVSDLESTTGGSADDEAPPPDPDLTTSAKTRATVMTT